MHDYTFPNWCGTSDMMDPLPAQQDWTWFLNLLPETYPQPASEAAPLFSEIRPRLFQGGTDDDDWLDATARLGTEVPADFDAVVTLFAYARPCASGITELRYGFPDADLSEDDLARIVEAARWAHARWTAGDRVLIRCQAGLNRSGLVTALVLMMEGRTAAAAIRLIRARRSPDALFNRSFVAWLVTKAADAIDEDAPWAA